MPDIIYPIIKGETKGSELGHIIRFALPMLAGNLFQQFYNVADSIIDSNPLRLYGCMGNDLFYMASYRRAQYNKV